MADYISQITLPDNNTYDIKAKALSNISLTSTTINNTAGSFAFSGSGAPWAGTDWVGLQIGDNVDKFQISAGGAGSNSLLFRQNDSGGTNTSWGNWQMLGHANSGTAVGNATTPIYMSSDGTLTAGTALGTASTHAHEDYALSTHTHSLSIATDTGTSSITLAANSKYKLTAGGKTYIFTTQNDAAKLNQSTATALNSFTDGSALIYTAAGGSNGLADKPTGVDAFGCLSFKTASGWYGQLLVSSNQSSGIYWRTATTLSGGWNKVLDSNNSGAGTNNNATLAWSTTYIIAKINGTDIKFTTMAKPSYSYSDISSRPTSIKLTGAVTGTVTLGNGENSIATSVNHNHDDRYKIASGVITLGSSTITPVTSVNGHSGASVNVTASDLGLASALKYVGTKSSLPTATDSTTYSTYNNGDVITVSNKEYAYVKGSNAAESSWVELGDEGSYKLKQTAFTNSTGTADGSNTSTTFIYSFSQDANGTITDIKTRKLPTLGVADISNIANNYLKLDGSNNMTADVNIIVGDTDKFVNFWYNTNKKAGASWRIGMLGSGSSDTNYFSIESGTSTTTATTWTSALRIGQNTYDIGIKGNLYPYDTTTSLGTNSKKWGDVYATTFKSGTWNGTQIGVAYGGTGTTTGPSQGGIIYGSSSTAYASTAAGITGQVLKSHGTDAPEWENEYSIEIIQL